VNGEFGVRCKYDPLTIVTVALMPEFLVSIVEVVFPSFTVGYMEG